MRSALRRQRTICQVDSHPIFHHAGPKLFIERTFGEHCGDAPSVKVLLLGDSWMQDQGLAGVIGDEIASKLGKCVLAINGAFYSYSPTLYLLKAKHAVESYGRFDTVLPGSSMIQAYEQRGLRMLVSTERRSADDEKA